jgi:hypothetical protein
MKYMYIAIAFLAFCALFSLESLGNDEGMWQPTLAKEFRFRHPVTQLDFVTDDEFFVRFANGTLRKEAVGRSLPCNVGQAAAFATMHFDGKLLAGRIDGIDVVSSLKTEHLSPLHWDPQIRVRPLGKVILADEVFGVVYGDLGASKAKCVVAKFACPSNNNNAIAFAMHRFPYGLTEIHTASSSALKRARDAMDKDMDTPPIEPAVPPELASELVCLIDEGQFASMAFSPDGTRLGIARTTGRVDVFDVNSRKLINTIIGEPGIYEMVFLDESSVVIARHRLQDDSTGLTVWDGHKEKALLRLKGRSALTLDSTGKIMAISQASDNDSSIIHFIDTKSLAEIKQFKAPMANVKAIAFERENRVIAVGGTTPDEPARGFPSKQISDGGTVLVYDCKELVHRRPSQK